MRTLGITAASTILFVAPLAGYELDKRVRSEAIKYYLVFIARSSPGIGPGHAYVALGQEDEAKRMSVGSAIGFYPAEGQTWKVLVGTEGEIKDEVRKGSAASATQHLVVLVNRETYFEAIRAVDAWKRDTASGRTEFALLSQNCTDFVSDIARAANIKAAPNRLRFPQAYLQSLIDANRP